ncbi:MAG: glycosyl transferase [Clostridia bacterium]|nr:glycosyl transferase [Clostridia bacterium]
MLARIKEILCNPCEFGFWLSGRRICRIIPDKAYIKFKYRCILRRWPDLDNPRYLSEKIQWLKLHDRNALYPNLVDKYAVRSYVAEQIGEEYLVPLIGVWNSPLEIDWNSLPDKFVLKTVDGSHTNIICTKKEELDKDAAVKRLLKWQKSNQTFYYGREWPYKQVKPRIIAEEYIESTVPGGLVDYKFMCFNGIADNVMICSDRQTGKTRFDHFDKDWKHLKYQHVDLEKPADYTVPKPAQMDEMFRIAELLAKPFPYVRVDLYCERDKIYFGELTFYPQSGFDADFTEQTDLYLGAKLDLNFITKND